MLHVKIKRWVGEAFFAPWVELTYDISNGEYGIRQCYRSRMVLDKFQYREYNKILPTKKMVIPHKDFLRLVGEAETFLSVHKKYGGKVV